MKRNILFIGLLIVLVLAFLIFLLGEFNNVYEQPSDSDFKDGDFINEDINNGINNSLNDSDIVTSSFGDVSDEGAGEESSYVSGENIPDIEAEACGFYFEGYGVCAGTCPEGTCVQDGGSCYCQG